jgi:F-type H+-transporting ATPase subunit delta
MKISPKNYAVALVESLNTASPKEVAKQFRRLLQKNGQYKDLGRVISMLDQVSADQQGLVLAKVYSEKGLDQNETKEVQLKIEKRLGKKILIKNIIKPNMLSGILVKAGDKEFDITVEGNISKLKQKLAAIQ